jgi:hypothetical protein
MKLVIASSISIFKAIDKITKDFVIISVERSQVNESLLYYIDSHRHVWAHMACLSVHRILGLRPSHVS